MTAPDLLADEIDRELRSRGTAERAVKEQAYLKSDLEHYGTTVPDLRSITKAFSKKHAPIGHDDLIPVVVALWRVPVHERRTAAVELLVEHASVLRSRDVKLIERLLRESRTWALVDVLAGSVVGTLFDRDPKLGSVLDRWAADDDFWIRRSALLALLGGLRRGAGDFDRFSRYADSMLEEKEFFVRKAIGWVLRETGKKRPDLVYAWVLPRVARASGVTLREAIKPLTELQRASVLSAR